MSYSILLKINEATHGQFETIRQQLNAGTHESQSRVLGEVLSEIACDIVEQVFSVLLIQNRQPTQLTQKYTAESEKVIQQIIGAVRKYMPWSIALFGNERLCPFANYFSNMIKYHDEQVYVSYPIDRHLVQQAHALVTKLKNNEISDMVDVFQTLVQIVDLGVTNLIREPKKCLNFNTVVDKTLNGVINMTAHLSYKRLEKMGNQVDTDAAADCVNHFLAFMHVDAE
ncbi:MULTISPECIES: hypothetical protein [Acinetobacter]|uniref:Uncharacterized protein n=1 Tax=Acinetobacter thutiue TaxID=2998078 RepID=A0ABT7WTG0_9GAMM|nr:MULTISPECIES: hypothetical protein [Acinetobacter]MCY6413839.1 hypothetical protein [Acinetobacter thutiue]MDH0030689.1 hypothetical protein [Acinetobacter sp. GD04021]MDH0886201.1 hypothetical protein [Acinetobacter sp. GD03873]MDH1081825.1 hypothetical protein [Acinetobacter sp. GD03983]MDH2189678.1 hypothetical protein [Acinetobacter sp. GD03645]